jgi:tetratricopeptide (TPR) repeat protein
MLRTCGAVICAVTFVAILSLATTRAVAVPQTSSSQNVTGIVLYGRTPVSGARILITQSGTSKPDEAVTDAEGKFSLVTAKAGDCLLRVHKDGYRDSELLLKLPLRTEAPVRVSLSRTSAGPEANSQAGMQFSDKPDFTVAGITDWTAAGGHGSDLNLRASESLAKDTRSVFSTIPPAKPDLSQERELRNAVLKDPASFQANRAMGEFCLRQRQFGDAIPPLEKAYQLNPADFENSYQLAQAYDGAGRYADAKLLVSQLLAQNDRPELHRLLGDIEEQLNNPLASEREYERAVQLQPSEDNYSAFFAKGAKAFPHSERMLAGLGAALYAHGSYEDGAQRVCDASDLNPSNPQPYLFLGKMEQASPRPLPCVAEKLAQFVHTHSDNASANYYYAIALLNSDEKSHLNQAATLLQNAVRLDPKFAQAYLQLGVLQTKRGDWQSARECYEKAAAGDPNFPDPHFRLAQLYRRTGERQKMSQELQTFERLKQSDAASVEQRRREIRQFVVVMKDASATPAN